MKIFGLYLFVVLCFLPALCLADGNNTLGTTYVRSKCGLNYVSASRVLGKRFMPKGIDQPAPFVITGIPPCALVERAFIYADASGNGETQTVKIAKPFDTVAFPMTLIGTSGDKCWNYPASVSYRADVTSEITGNGIYYISGLSTDSTGSPGKTDIDGATLIIIYSDQTQPWQGTIIMDDGAKEGSVIAYNMTRVISCGPPLNAKAFMAIGDLQNHEPVNLNGDTISSSTSCWNFFELNTDLDTIQTSSHFSIDDPSDCYNIVLTGIYYQTTNCAACVPPSTLQATTTSTSADCDICNGIAHVTVTGGLPPFSYSWAPTGGNSADATNLCAGTYTVTVTGSCTGVEATVTVPSFRPIALGNDTAVCEGTSLKLQPDDTSGSNYVWSTGETVCCITIDSPGTYWLQKTNNCGSSTDTIKVSARFCTDDDCMFFPTAFSPNNDGRNDTYGPVSFCKEAPLYYLLQIYNRWGQKVFESKDIDVKWDGRFKGRPQQVGVYFYQLRYGRADGSGSTLLKGDLILVL